MSKDNKLTDPKDIKKAIGNPKIIFVLGKFIYNSN